MKYALFFILNGFVFLGIAQTGHLRGKVVDAKTGETLPGAIVQIEALKKAAVTDFDGNFSISGLPMDSLKLSISYISYSTKVINGILLNAKEPLYINVALDPADAQQLNEVVVEVKISKENNTALVLQQKNNASVSDGVSAETIKRTPDRNTSDVLKRVSGASIQDNKFAIVRGLNDRYNAAFLNGAPLPSSESDRKAFAFDVFPSNMLDNLVITKTARPDLPGEFAGGIIDISTKGIPDVNFISASLGSAYNTITTGQKQLYYNGGKTDWLGIDDGTRELPTAVPSYSDFPTALNKQAELAKQVPVSDWGIYEKQFMPNVSAQLSAGYNLKRNDQDFLGIIASLSYNSTRSFFETERISYLSGRPDNEKDPLLKDKNFNDATYQTQNLMGVLLNSSLKLNAYHSISIKNLYTINSDDRTIRRIGTTTPNEENQNIVRSTALWFTQNTILSQQLSGEHFFSKSKIKFQWNAARSNVKRQIPNLRRHYYQKLSKISNDPSDTVYKALLSLNNSTSNEYSGIMLWSDLTENIYSFKGDVSRSFKYKTKITLEPKLGCFIQNRSRIFDYRQFVYSSLGGAGSSIRFADSLAALNENSIFTSSNMGIIDPQRNLGGFKLVETTQQQSDYTAQAKLRATYAMFDFRYAEWFRMVTGIRQEHYFQQIEFRDPLFMVNKKMVTIDTVYNDVLPSANIIISPNDKTNLRVSYARTLNRPEFRELAPFIFYDFNTQFSLNGDPKLQRALIDNYDFRAEWFPGAGQLISASLFYKDFTNPIELFQSQNASQISFTNVAKAYNRGFEFEYRFQLGAFYSNDSSVIGKLLDRTTLFSNIAIINSQVGEGTGATYSRPLQGQSPYVINAGISYYDLQTGFNISVNYNRIGERIYIVGNNLFQEIWECPRDVLDLQLSKSFLNKKLDIRLNIKDLLAQPLVFVQNYANAPITLNDPLSTAPFWKQTFGRTIGLQVNYKF
jgi:TonB-dependent receptor